MLFKETIPVIARYMHNSGSFSCIIILVLLYYKQVANIINIDESHTLDSAFSACSLHMLNFNGVCLKYMTGKTKLSFKQSCKQYEIQIDHMQHRSSQFPIVIISRSLDTQGNAFHISYLRKMAAFRSSKFNECYIFVDEKFVLLNYAPGAKKEVILEGPLNIVEGFPMLDNTIFRYEIESSFDTDNNEAFIFSRHECALIDYAPHSKNGTILLGPISITAMFPCLKGTALETGITAAFRSAGNMVFLFKGDEYARIDFKTKKLMSNVYIRNGFQSLVGTVFEYGIDTAFSSHVKDEAYIFKNEYYACINYAPSTTSGDFIVNGRIRRIRDDWPALHGILK